MSYDHRDMFPNGIQCIVVFESPHGDLNDVCYAPGSHDMTVHMARIENPNQFITVVPDLIIDMEAVAADPDSFERLFDLLDEGLLFNFTEVRRRLEELRPLKDYTVEVTFTYTAQEHRSDEEAESEASANLEYHLRFLDDVEIQYISATVI